MRSKLYVSVLLGVLVCVNSSFAGWTSWDPAGDQDWFSAENWSAGVPSDGSPTAITLGGSDAAVISGGSATVRYLFVGDSSGVFTAWGALGELKITETGSLQVNGVSHSYIGGDTTLTPTPDGEGIVTVDGGSVNVLARTFYVGEHNHSKGTLNIINGGTFTTAGAISLGRTEGYIKLYDGTLTVDLDTTTSFYLNANADVDIKGTGMLRWKGDHVAALKAHERQDRIHTSESDKTLTVELIEDYTVVYIKED